MNSMNDDLLIKTISDENKSTFDHGTVRISDNTSIIFIFIFAFELLTKIELEKFCNKFLLTQSKSIINKIKQNLKVTGIKWAQESWNCFLLWALTKLYLYLDGR